MGTVKSVNIISPCIVFKNSNVICCTHIYIKRNRLSYKQNPVFTSFYYNYCFVTSAYICHNIIFITMNNWANSGRSE
jgi:hypothetical protein